MFRGEAACIESSCRCCRRQPALLFLTLTRTSRFDFLGWISAPWRRCRGSGPIPPVPSPRRNGDRWPREHQAAVPLHSPSAHPAGSSQGYPNSLIACRGRCRCNRLGWSQGPGDVVVSPEARCCLPACHCGRFDAASRIPSIQPRRDQAPATAPAFPLHPWRSVRSRYAHRRRPLASRPQPRSPPSVPGA